MSSYVNNRNIYMCVTYTKATNLFFSNCILYFLTVVENISLPSSLCCIIKICADQCYAVQFSAWRSRLSFKWGPEGTKSWTAGHIQRELPHIMGSNTRCWENREYLLCWLTLHPLIPCRTDIDCGWSVLAPEHPVCLTPG